MDDIADKLTQLLNDPQGMAELRTMAEGLLGSGGANESKPALPFAMGEFGDIMNGMSQDQMSTMMKMVKAFGNTKDDDRTRLLMALRPHLSDKRQQRIDQAVKLLKLSSVLPLIGESGLFSL